MSKVLYKNKFYGLKIVAFGDSLIDKGYWGYLAALNPPNSYWPSLLELQMAARVINKGIGGNTTIMMQDRILTDVVAYHPDYCVIMGGGNDIYSRNNPTYMPDGYSVSAYITRIASMVNACKENDIFPILCTEPIGWYDAATASTETALIEEQRQALLTYAQSDNVVIVDLCDSIVYTNNSYRPVDNVHPNPAGQMIMAAMIYDKFNSLVSSALAQTATVLDINWSGKIDTQTSAFSYSLLPSVGKAIGIDFNGLTDSTVQASSYMVDNMTISDGTLTLTPLDTANIIGIVRVSTGGGAGTWARIDKDGNDLGTADFNTLYPWSQMTNVTIAGNVMTKVPKFWYKNGTVASGTHVGKPALWIADQAVTEFKIHPAFMHQGTEKNCYYLGSYSAGGTSAKANSIAGVAPLILVDFPTIKAACAANNTGTGDNAGWHLQTFYEVCAFNMLLLVELGTPDVQMTIGSGNNSGTIAKNGATNAVYRGVHEWWNNIWERVDGFKLDTNNILIYDLQGNETYVSTGKTLPSAGWIVDMMTDATESYDLGSVFIPLSTGQSYTNGTYGDNCGGATDNGILLRSLPSGSSTSAGAFGIAMHVDAAYSGGNSGGRLAKYDV